MCVCVSQHTSMCKTVFSVRCIHLCCMVDKHTLHYSGKNSYFPMEDNSKEFHITSHHTDIAMLIVEIFQKLKLS